MTAPPDVSHASPEAAALFEAYHRVKSAHDLDAWMDFFAPTTVYGDATLGWFYPDRDALRATLTDFVPHWGNGRSYSTRVLGDTASAILAVTDTPELFGSEIRSLSSVDLVDGKIVRFIDYWDSRHFGTDAAAQMRTPDAQFPAEISEPTVPSSADPVMTATAHALTDALNRNDADAAADLFTDDGVFEDMNLHTQILGRLAISRYLHRSDGGLPYACHARVSHVLGNNLGGGYEWTAPHQPVRSGVVALELDAAYLITRLTAVWDGGRLDLQRIQAMTTWSLEQPQ